MGRDEEVVLLRKAVADVAAGRGRALLVEGEPGIGKSALLAAGLARAVDAGCVVLHGVCDALGQRFPLSVMKEALGIDEGSSDPRRAAAATALSSSVEAGAWGVAGDPVMAAVERVLGLVDRLTADGPLVLIVEDLHWLDEASVILWRGMCRAATQSPLLLVGSYRPTAGLTTIEQVRRVVLETGGLVIPLHPLPPSCVTTMASDILGAEPGIALTEQLRLASGNPLYVRELLDALRRADAVHLVAGRAELRTGAAPVAIVSLAGVIADRLDFLSGEVRDVLRTAALLGPDFSVTDLAAIVGRPVPELVPVLEGAIAVGVVEPYRRRLRFRHGLLRQTLYEAMPTAVRSAMYRHAAQVLFRGGASVERVAQLVLNIPEEADGWELDWIAENAVALTHRSPGITSELLERALRQLRESDPRYAVLEDQLGVVAYLLGRWDQAERLARLARVRAMGDPERLCRADWLLGRSLQRMGRSSEALEALTAAVTEPGRPPAWLARLNALRSSSLRARLQVDEAEMVALNALDTAERTTDPVGMAFALHSLSMQRVTASDLEAGLAYVDRALAVSAGHDDLADLHLQMLGNRFTMLTDLDRLPEATEGARQALALAERIGNIPRLDDLRVQAASVISYPQGRWDDALTDLELASEVPAGSMMGIIRCSHLALIAAHRDDGAEAARQVEMLARVKAGAAKLGPEIMVRAAQAAQAERSGRPDLGVEELRPLLAPDSDAATLERGSFLPALTRLATSIQDSGTAHAAVEVAECEDDFSSTPQGAAVALWCRGLLDRTPEAIEGAAAYYRRSGRTAMLGFVLEDAAESWAATGEHDKARPLLAEALGIYSNLGAIWTVRRAMARLRVHGVRPGVRGMRQRPTTGWQALTDSELRIAELVAKGWSNPDIAGQLMLSRRTVETHVSHILAKLRITSRREVARLVGETD
ncbi:AAA family ATPase [Streptomyces sp. PTM05]|uniref:AAA family ATPase n=1 Tax=Streptantibioticus parmotrematis TaxID=2873249 RepID=A0ABS7QUX9_9ACTN|nr:LuxR family transcriptional regulator [Streptantibioticus parmotrematis]MBY8887023.1 AAA family ATPase [Streptantibioticus parmotrematis]